MCCGPRLPVESIVTSTLSAFSFFIVVVLVRSGQTLSITASLEVSFTNRRLQPLSIFCIDFCCSSRLSVQTIMVGIGLPDVLKLATSISAFHCPFCMPLNIFGVNTSSAATAAAKPSAQTAAILTAWIMVGSPRLDASIEPVPVLELLRKIGLGQVAEVLVGEGIELVLEPARKHAL